MNNAVAPPSTSELIPNGTYQPLPYVVPALFIRLGWSAASADRFARLGSMLVTLVFLAMAVVMIRQAGGRHLVAGLIVATTPMVLFCGGSLQPSGPEIASALALVTALVALGRGHTKPFVYAVAALSGSFMTLSRSLSPLLFLLVVASFVWWLGTPESLNLVRTRRREGWAMLGAWLVALGLNRAWEALFGPTATIRIDSLSALVAALATIRDVTTQQIGVFGYLEVRLPLAAYATWYVLLGSLLMLALLVGSRRQRALVVSLVVSAIALPTVLLAAFLVHTGFGVQGRHVLPFVAVIPIFAGEIFDRRSEDLGQAAPRHLVAWIGTGAAVVHVIALYTNARRHAVGVSGPVFFFPSSQWSPRGGWLPVAVVTVAGASLMALGSVWTSRAAFVPAVEVMSEDAN
jgi:hypothetical protein